MNENVICLIVIVAMLVINYYLDKKIAQLHAEKIARLKAMCKRGVELGFLDPKDPEIARWL
jgi:hypothetical protein